MHSNKRLIYLQRDGIEAHWDASGLSLAAAHGRGGSNFLTCQRVERMRCVASGTKIG